MSMFFVTFAIVSFFYIRNYEKTHSAIKVLQRNGHYVKKVNGAYLVSDGQNSGMFTRSNLLALASLYE